MNNTRINLLCLFLALLAACFVCPGRCQAEPVRIQTPSGAVGMGWLFGAQQAGSETLQCWIVTPRHVINNQDTGEPQAFIFFRENGSQGQSEKPLVPAIPADAAQKPANRYDLAFARVQWLKGSQRCNSRLGVVESAYSVILRDTQEYLLRQMYNTSSGQFAVRMLRKGVDEQGGTTLDFTSDDAKAKNVFLQGISGSTITASYDGKSEPVAMVQQYNGAQNTLRSLRYDYIRSAFATVQGQKALAQKDANTLFDLISADYTPDMPGDFGPGALAQGNACWKARSDKARKGAEVVIVVREKALIASIIPVQSDQCKSEARPFWIDFRGDDSHEWSYLCSGKFGGNEEKPCRVNLQGPRQFRLRFDVRNSHLAISGIKIH